MKKFIRGVAALLVLAAVVLGLSGCPEQEGPAEQAGEQIDESVEEGREQLEEAGEEARE